MEYSECEDAHLLFLVHIVHGMRRDGVGRVGETCVGWRNPFVYKSVLFFVLHRLYVTL